MPIRLSIELCETQYAFTNSQGVDYFLRSPTGIPIEKKVYLSGIPSYVETEVKLFGVHDSSSNLNVAFLTNCETCSCLFYTECEIKNTRILVESDKYRYSQRRPVFKTDDEYDVFLPNEWVCNHCIREAILADTPFENDPQPDPDSPLDAPELDAEDIDYEIVRLADRINLLR
ncbi:suppressor of gene silencing [Snake melon asteroid mosaic virus]|uniref:Suppressor of gene silencing n=1 Tax=Snake melon asteroid mosaic virus TaxID=870588 RepID=A0AAE7UHV9_9VIRU|nr:suppressor of gene silencing [Snake melon asteroid mosaic virus]QSM07157.1 suppressor of gene silencing [Snake melon asteroid mosaic virus]